MTTYARRGAVRSDAAHDVLGPSTDVDPAPVAVPSWKPKPTVEVTPYRPHIATYNDGSQDVIIPLNSTVVLGTPSYRHDSEGRVMRKLTLVQVEEA